jgi:hypothetical protein
LFTTAMAVPLAINLFGCSVRGAAADGVHHNWLCVHQCDGVDGLSSNGSMAVTVVEMLCV